MENEPSLQHYLKETGVLDNLTKSLVQCAEDSISNEQTLQIIIDNVCMVNVGKLQRENLELKQNIEKEKKIIENLQNS